MEIGRSIRKNTKIRPTVNEAKFHLPKKFNYLGNLLSTDRYSEKISMYRMRIMKARFNWMQKLMTGELKQELKKRLVKTLEWNVVAKGVEARGVRKAGVGIDWSPNICLEVDGENSEQANWMWCENAKVRVRCLTNKTSKLLTNIKLKKFIGCIPNMNIS